jgi:hydroxylamine reductase
VINDMFCEQCEQTASGQGCHQWGACGKSPEVNAMQDLLVYCLRGLAPVALQAKDVGMNTREVDVFTCEGLFATMTNVNFNQKSFVNYINRAIALRDNLKHRVEQKSNGKVNWAKISDFMPDFSESLADQGQKDKMFL